MTTTQQDISEPISIEGESSARSRGFRVAVRLIDFLILAAGIALLAYNGVLFNRRIEERKPLAPMQMIDAQYRKEYAIVEERKKRQGVEAVKRDLPNTVLFQALKQMLDRSPNDGGARRDLARLYTLYEEYLKSAQELHRVPIWWPTKREDQCIEGQSYMLANLPREAEAAFKACVKVDRLHPTPSRTLYVAHQELIKLYAIEDRLDDARAIIWDAYDQADQNEHSGILAMRMRLELERISPEGRAVELRKWIKADPDDVGARRALAMAERLIAGREAEADKQIKICLSRWPKDIGVWRDWLTIIKDRGDRDLLAAEIAKIPPGAEKDPVILGYRGIVLENQGKLKEAAELYRKVLEIKPGLAEFHYRLAMTAQRLGLKEESQEHFARKKELQDAYGKIPDVFQEYAKLLKQTPVDEKLVAEKLEELAKLCEVENWKRVAEAWRKLKPVIPENIVIDDSADSK